MIHFSLSISLRSQCANTSESSSSHQECAAGQTYLLPCSLGKLLSFLLRKMHSPQTAACTCRAFPQPPKKLQRAQSCYSGCPSTSHLPESPMPVGAGSFKMDWLVLSHITLGMKLLMARPDYSSNIPTLCQINGVDVTSFAEDRKPLQSCNQQPSLVPGHSTYPGVIKASFHASAHLG